MKSAAAWLKLVVGGTDPKDTDAVTAVLGTKKERTMRGVHKKNVKFKPS